MSYPPMNGQHSQGFSIDNNHGSEDPPSLKSQRAGKKKVFRRGTAFTKEEDMVVCSAFLNISKDPITGVSQTLGGYYKRMHDYFNEHKPEGSNRSQIAIQHRWALIQKAMNKFCGHKASVDRLNESRKNKQDRKKHMKMSVKQHKKENEIREKQTEAQLISVESSIMSIDIEKVPPI
ncbi:hypothetical protein E2562_035573 [Oryza meyeriana var. granulata]|uniref:No apical meristem-associated C-terminal domain-containing protein n=1 Tax=Oryza meyeriana var. granulata TaxID=110450 RepID=A0A6G1ESU0_9ORYZ|nr:hypothetical protein E2562_035573 [Oryza meyeriana var. granulata]